MESGGKPPHSKTLTRHKKLQFAIILLSCGVTRRKTICTNGLPPNVPFNSLYETTFQ